MSSQLRFLIFSLLLTITISLFSSISASSVLRLPSDNIGDSSNICPLQDPGSSSCPVKCFKPDPVCGENGVTYWCGCSDAGCAGIRVAKKGYCEIGNGGSGPLSGQALLLVHIVWLIVLGFSVLCGLL